MPPKPPDRTGDEAGEEAPKDHGETIRSLRASANSSAAHSIAACQATTHPKPALNAVGLAAASTIDASLASIDATTVPL